jgi:hypothetical protein
MVRLVFIAVFLAASAHAIAGDSGSLPAVDLRAPGALEQLRQTNPAHFEKLQRVLAGLLEQPARVEGDWLQVSFDARDVDLSRYVIKTSNPPKQLLQFTLDDVRYTMHVIRSDLTATVDPAG